jgi:ketosteroid isomerase-like protein
MTTRPGISLALCAVIALSAGCSCSPKRIPGTEIEDTGDNRAVYEVVRVYQKALEARDAPTILSLVSPDYFDASGTPDPADDLDRAQLEKSLAADLARLEGVRMDVTLRRIDVQRDTATAEIFYETYYRVQTPSGAIPRRDADVHRLVLKKMGEQWKIAAGL